jgi:hypothetical protein
VALQAGLISAVLLLLAQRPEMSPAALEYLTKALDLIQANALTRERVDWPTVRAHAFAQASDAPSPADMYDAIRSVLTALGDHHSSFQTRESMDALNRQAAAMLPAPSGFLLDGRLAHVVVPGCCSDRDAAAQYATTLQNVLRSLDVPTTCGWIVDLRKNIGGNMWPTLAGLGPLLTGGPLGSFIAPNGHGHGYEDGVLPMSSQVRVTTTPQ